MKIVRQIASSAARLSALPFRGWRGRGPFRWLAVIDHILKFFAGFEIGDLLGRHFHARAGFGIAAYARLALPRAKTAKAADLNLVARPQGADNAVKNRFHDDFTVFARQLRQA